MGGGLVEFFPDEASARVCEREILRHDPRYQPRVGQYFRDEIEQDGVRTYTEQPDGEEE